MKKILMFIMIIAISGCGTFNADKKGKTGKKVNDFGEEAGDSDNGGED